MSLDELPCPGRQPSIGYLYHAVAYHGIVIHVAFLKFLYYYIFALLVIFHMHHCVMEIRVKGLAGVDKVYKQLLTVFDELGVKPIEAVGQPFDPNFHNAVMHVEDDEQGENVVIEEFQKGYMYHDSVVRHSMVKVAN